MALKACASLGTFAALPTSCGAVLYGVVINMFRNKIDWIYYKTCPTVGLAELLVKAHNREGERERAK